MQELDELLSKAADSLAKAQESQISLTEKRLAQSSFTKASQESVYFNSLQSNGLVLLKNKILDSNPTATAALKKEKSLGKDKTAGPQWFNMPAMEMTEDVKKDLHILKNRGALDPKRHYRKEKLGNSPFIQIGTVIQGPTEYYSSRLLRKERGQNIVQELLADAESNNYFKNKYLEIQEKKSRFTKRKVYKRKGRRL